jgi:hypothetical protein
MNCIHFCRKMIFTVFALFFYSFIIANTSEITFYVSPSGNDSWTGESIDKPFATIQRARDVIREMKKKSGLTQPVTVYIRDGIYELEETLVFKQEDSGTSTCPIQYVAYQDEKPVISGGKKITGQWKHYKGDIQVCSIDAVKEGKWYFRQLFLNGERQTRARIPNKGFYTIDKTEEDIGRDAFKYRENDIKNWKNLNDVEVVILHFWNDSRLRVSELDEQEKIVTFTGRIGRILGQGNELNRYYIENVLEGLDQPGEWYLDRNKGLLYYWPIKDLINSELRAPVLNELVRFEGGIENFEGDKESGKYVQYINIKGLNFCETDYVFPEQGIPEIRDVGDIWFPSAITLNGASECIFENNIIKNTGTYGLEITGDAIRVKGNEISYTGSGGIITRSYGKLRNLIMYNHIHHCGGDIFHSGVGINIDDGGGLIANNLVHDTGHSGIYGRHWPTNYGQNQERRNQEQGLIIEYNEIYNVMQSLNDGAGIFIRDDYIVIRNNLIHDCYSPPEGHGSPAWGIYLGCETRNCLVENNVIYRTEAGQHVWFKNRNNTIFNNIFIDGNNTQIGYHNPLNISKYPRDMSHEDVRSLRNIFYFSNPDGNLYLIHGKNSLPRESDYNIYYHPSKGKEEFIIRAKGLGWPGGVEDLTVSFEEWQNEYGLDKHSVVADPLFVDPENDDYSLRAESPALKMGFKPIDLSRVGLKGYSTKKNQISDEKQQYTIVEAKVRVYGEGSQSYKDYQPFKTRTVELLAGYTPPDQPVELSKYGGWLDKQVGATGFFYVKKIDGRWWGVDPDGYLYINIGLSSINMGGSEQNQAALKQKFGTPENWIQKTIGILHENGFNCAGSWSDHKLIIEANKIAERPFAYTINWNFMSSYGRKRGGTYQQAGHTGYPNDAIFVFDPEFEAFCDIHAQQLIAAKNDPNLFGHFSDNELPFNFNSLDNYLALPVDEPGYKVVIEWIKEKGITAEQITDMHREEFLSLIAEKYFSIVSNAIKKYDPNHMYIGARLYGNERHQPAFMKTAGKYLDIVSCNHYGYWTPLPGHMENWERWTGKPFIITEYYTKGEDSGLPNQSGAGWIVRTQRDRGLFLQNYNLALLESKNCVGFHYFKYQDNDPTAKGVDPSNIDANKGMVNNKYEIWEDMMEKIKELNLQVYPIIQHFDRHNE